MNSSLPEPDNDGTNGDHLNEGDLFSIYGLNGESVYKIAKVVKLRDNGVHIFVYDRSFSARPSNSELNNDALSPDWPDNIDARRARYMCYPVCRKLFSLMRPVYLGNRSAADIEMQGYRQWCLTGGGELLGSDISLDDELDNNSSVYARIYFSYFTPTLIACSCYMVAFDVWELIPFAFLFGAAFGGVMMALQWASINRQRKETLSKISVSSTQFREIEMNLPYLQAFESGVRALSEINNCQPVAVDINGGTIEGRVRKSMMEEGQEILMVFSRAGGNRTVCIVWSESTLGITVDMGKNLSNVNAIISFLKSSADAKEPFSLDLRDNKADKLDNLDA